MKKLFTLFSFAFTASLATAQSFSSPESVERNLPDDSYFISNNGTGEILKMLPDGTLQNFATGFSAGPHGLELMGDTLYACDGSSLKLVNRNTGAIIQTVNLGATFLNGITHKGDDLFITDFSAKKIYRYNTITGSHNVFVNSTVGTPNGIIYDDMHNVMVYVCWGSSAPVYRVNYSDSTVTLLANTTVGNIDGIAVNCMGYFYISSWSPNQIRLYDQVFSSYTTLVSTGLSSPADIYYDKQKDTLYVPNSGAGNNVTWHYAPGCIFVGTNDLENNENEVNVFPNPFTNTFTLQNIQAGSRVELVNASGDVVLQQTALSNTVQMDAASLPAGIYLAKITFEGQTQTLKLCRQ